MPEQGARGHPGPAQSPPQGPTRVDEFVPLQIPDAVEDAPADLTRVDVPGGGREPQQGSGRSTPPPRPASAQGRQQSRYWSKTQEDFRLQQG